MSESLSNLNDLTTRMNAPNDPTLNEYGEVETVDEKLSRATLLIKDAQETLLSAQATEKILALKDDEIVLLKEQLRMSLSDLEAAISEIAHVNEDAVKLAKATKVIQVVQETVVKTRAAIQEAEIQFLKESLRSAIAEVAALKA